MNPATTGDEYATLIASSGIFAGHTPSPTLPEGLRGEILKITTGDPEAGGQLRLILGSYVTNVNASGAFTFSFNGGTTGSFDGSSSLSAVKAALEALPGIGVGKVAVTRTGSTYRVELLGTLYLTNDLQFTVAGLATAAIDDTSVKLNSPWSVEPTAGKANFEVSLYEAVHVPNVKVAIFSKAAPAIVVSESEGSTNIAQGSGGVATNHDQIQVKLSVDPLGSKTVTLDESSGLVQYWQSGIHDNTVDFSSLDWGTFKTVEVRAVDDGVIRGFHRRSECDRNGPPALRVDDHDL